MTQLEERPLRIAAIDPERNFGGGEAQVLGLTRELLRHGHQAELVCDPEGELCKRAQLEGITSVPLRVRNSIDFAAGFRLRRLVCERNYDVLHFHTARAHALAPYTRASGALQIATRRMDYVPNRLFARWLYNHAVDRVIVISRGVAEAVRRGGAAPHRLRLVHSGVDCAHFAPPSPAARAAARAQLGLADADVAIGAVGALTRRKGHRVLLDAMALARAKSARPLRCFVAGKGPLAAGLARAARQPGDPALAVLLGEIQDSRMLLWALDVFVMPSLQEGLGVAALEALACGLPVIATNVGGLPDAIDESVGRLVTPGDGAGLAHAIVELSGSPVLMTAAGRAARTRAITYFSLEAMARGTLKVYFEGISELLKLRTGI